jgi:hypothetical protein
MVGVQSVLITDWAAMVADIPSIYGYCKGVSPSLLVRLFGRFKLDCLLDILLLNMCYYSKKVILFVGGSSFL